MNVKMNVKMKMLRLKWIVFNLVDRVKDIVFSRRRIAFKSLDVIWSMTKFLYWCESKKLNTKHRQEIFKEGQERLSREMDWVSIVHSIRQLELLTKHLLTENQRFLTLYNNTSLLDWEENDNSYINLLSDLKDIPSIYGSTPMPAEYIDKVNFKLSSINSTKKNNRWD